MVVSSCQTFWRMLLSGISYVYVQTAMVQFFFSVQTEMDGMIKKLGMAWVWKALTKPQ